MRIRFRLYTVTMSKDHLALRTHEKMREVLMHPDVSTAPSVHYYMIRGGTDMRNITVWEPGTIGDEYIKTYGHYHIGQLDETYWVLLGEGVVLQQKLVTEGETMQPDRVEEFRAIPVKRNDSVYMPPGYGHLVANIGKTYLLTPPPNRVANPRPLLAPLAARRAESERWRSSVRQRPQNVPRFPASPPIFMKSLSFRCRLHGGCERAHVAPCGTIIPIF